MNMQRHGWFAFVLLAVVSGTLLWLWPGLTGPRAQSADLPRLSLDEASARLREKGFVLMMRHAQTDPGVGDPANFQLGDCSTQRNLADVGREQSRRIGQGLLKAGVVIDVVRSSQWCRCLETARLAFGHAEEWSVLNSTFRDRDQQAERSRQIVDFAKAMRPRQNVMLVTHQVIISPLSGGWVESAEVVAFRLLEGRLVAQFRITPPSVSGS